MRMSALCCLLQQIHKPDINIINIMKLPIWTVTLGGLQQKISRQRRRLSSVIQPRM